jgi:dihydropteroate synthase-like protein
MSGPRTKIAFVTGKLAAPALEGIVAPLGQQHQFIPVVLVQKISVAALMTVDWLRGKIQLPEGCQRVVLPGNVRGNIERLEEEYPGVHFERGPENFLDLPQHFGASPNPQPGPNESPIPPKIEILSEINHANRLSPEQVEVIARRLRRDGADIIDLGGTPDEDWKSLEATCERLVSQGFRVSIDSFNAQEVARAVGAGASLILSAHVRNWEPLAHLGAEIVGIPEDPHGPAWLDELSALAEGFDRAGVAYRLDPVLEPIGFGFARSLARYFEVRQAFPSTPVLMGVGNLTELTEVDSAGVNVLLIALCHELGIGSVLTTEVINWARSSTREIALARQMIAWASAHGRLPKNAGGQLTLLRDPRPREWGLSALRQMHEQVRDPNFRIFAESGQVIVFNDQQFERGSDPFLLFDRLGVEDPSHAFYLGWEMMKASLAIQLGKQYTQDRALRWGFLTTEEISHRDRQRQNTQDDQRDDG